MRRSPLQLIVCATYIPSANHKVQTRSFGTSPIIQCLKTIGYQAPFGHRPGPFDSRCGLGAMFLLRSGTVVSCGSLSFGVTVQFGLRLIRLVTLRLWIRWTGRRQVVHREAAAATKALMNSRM
jgi:hypothetical protein